METRQNSYYPEPRTNDALPAYSDPSISSDSASTGFGSTASQRSSAQSSYTPCDPQDALEDPAKSRWDDKDIYKQVKHIGSGSYGSCFLLERKADAALRVCKITERRLTPDGSAYEAEPLEAKILREILPRHERICHLYDTIIQPSTIQLYFDYYSGGDLSEIIRLYEYHWEMIPEAFLWHALLQLSEALAYMHSGFNRKSLLAPSDLWTPVFHGDIKPANIFLSPPKPCSEDPLSRVYPSLILGDFGMSCLAPAANYGTLKYQPPEMPAISGPADVWSVGCVLHAMGPTYDAPVAPLPCNVLPTHVNMIEWLKFYPQARCPQPFYDEYTMELHDCVFSTFELDPRGRISGLELYKKSLAKYSQHIESDISVRLVPLIDCKYRGKMFDENGVTLHTDGIDL